MDGVWFVLDIEGVAIYLMAAGKQVSIVAGVCSWTALTELFCPRSVQTVTHAVSPGCPASQSHSCNTYISNMHCRPWKASVSADINGGGRHGHTSTSICLRYESSIVGS